MILTYIFVLFLSSSLSQTTPNNPPSPPLQKDSKIAIIGSGVSGTFLAHHLYKQGYTDVSVFEREDHPAHICETVWVDGKPNDASIVYAGVQVVANWPKLWKFLEPLKCVVSPLLALGAKLIPAWLLEKVPLGSVQVTTNDYDQHIKNLKVTPRVASPLPLRQFNDTSLLIGIKEDPDKVVTELIVIWEEIEGWIANGEVGIAKCLKDNIASPTETFKEWMTRKNLKYSGTYMAYLFDFFGNSVTMRAPACQVISGSLLKWHGAIPFFLLAALQASTRSATRVPPLMMVQALISLRSNSLLWQFDEGYCEVFKRTVTATKANFHFQEEVTSVAPLAPGHVEVVTTKGKHQFHSVVFAIRPQDFQKLNIRGFEDFRRIAYQVQVVRATGKVNASEIVVPEASETLNVVDPSFGTDSVTLTGHLGGFVVNYPHETPDVFALIGNAERGDQFENHFEADLVKFMKFGFKESFFRRVYDQGPNYITRNLEEFQNWIEGRQGKDGLYYVGEYIGGHGVPENFQYSKQFAEKYFPALSEGVNPDYAFAGDSQKQIGQVKYYPHKIGSYCQTGEGFEVTWLELAAGYVVLFGATVMAWASSLCCRYKKEHQA